jgi:NAD(P)-dependent dehydrogenase (short-subunit alcohol dehydrogenase family)
VLACARPTAPEPRGEVIAAELLKDQTAFVSGGAAGIGLAIARRFAEHGARVMIGDVREDAAQESAAHARAVGLEIYATQVDVADEAAVEKAFDDAQERLGPITAVVPNAGILRLAPAVDLSLGDFRRVLDVNLTGAFLTARVGARRMVSSGSAGTITFTASVAGVRGLPENAAYSAAKFGVIGISQCMALELADASIRVNAVSPGQVDTPMFHDVSRQRDVTTQELLARVPLARLAGVEEIADAFVWLASPMSSFVTGQTLIVDGGWTVT